MRNKTRLKKALKEVDGIFWFEIKAAWILYHVNGIENALRYVVGLRSYRFDESKKLNRGI